MSISKKLYYGFAGVLALVLLLLVVNLLALGREHATKARTDKTRAVEQATAAVRFQMMQNRLYLANYLLSGDRREMEQMTNGVMKFNDLLSKATAAVSIEEERSALARVGEAERNWFIRFADPLIEKRKQVDAGKATVAELQIFYLQQNPAEWLKNSTDPLDEAVAASTDALGRQILSDESAGLVTRMVTILGTILAVLMGIAIAYYTSKSITEPLTQLIGIAREMGDSGDLNHTIQIDRADEIGALARSFSNLVAYLKEMAAISEAIAGGDLTVEFTPRSQHDVLSNAFVKMTYGLRALVRHVRDSAAQVASGSGQVASASEESAKINVQAASSIDEVTSTMHEMSINVQNVVKNTQTQASSVSETSASIDQMVASIQRVADTAKILLEISQRSREEVQNGISTMEKATEGLTKINTSIHSSATIISNLGGRADDIGKIVEVIDDLAEQTNLLALNAAIEAARAGEHGLGFAVVADEVRKLAEKSAQSTREISELIQSIQKEARKAVENMEKSTAIVNEGLHLGSDLSNALHKISTVVTEVYNFAQEIGAATNEQSHGSSQIAKATTRLNEITHEISSSVEEQASGAQAVVKAMEKMRELTQRSTSGSTELAASAEQMSKMSRVLLESMDRFVLEGTNGLGGSGHTDTAKSRLAAAAGVANQAKGA